MLAYLRKPVHPAALVAAVAVAVRLRALRSEVTEVRRQLEDRKVIERAKGLVARYAGLAEEDAYARMRKLASDQNRKLVELAHAIIAAAQVFQAMEAPDQRRPTTNGQARPPRAAHPVARRTSQLT